MPNVARFSFFPSHSVHLRILHSCPDTLSFPTAKIIHVYKYKCTHIVYRTCVRNIIIIYALYAYYIVYAASAWKGCLVMTSSDRVHVTSADGYSRLRNIVERVQNYCYHSTRVLNTNLITLWTRSRCVSVRFEYISCNIFQRI